MKHGSKNETETEIGKRNWIWIMNGNLEIRCESDSEIWQCIWFWKLKFKLKYEYEYGSDIWLENTAERLTWYLNIKKDRD